MKPIRLAVICDFREEQWASMDLVGDMILAYMKASYVDQIEASRVCPPFRQRLTRWRVTRRLDQARNADRFLNRFWDYPRALKGLVGRDGFDLFHVVDHSYGQLVHALPTDRTVVTCHDLDTFRCLLEPQREHRPRWFRAMAQRTLDGLQKAAAVVCDSETVCNTLRARGLVPNSRLHVAHLGTDPAFTPAPDPVADAEATRLLGPADSQGSLEILHVGSTIRRKRIDLLLAIFAAIHRACPHVRLIKAGGTLTSDQWRLAQDLGVAHAILVLPFFAPGERATLAAVYRRAALVLQPSDAEGFGLPVAEALACGTTVLASDLPVLREVGADAAVYQPVGDVEGWAASALVLLEDCRSRSDAWHARRNAGLTRARVFQWPHHVQQLATIYRSVLNGD